MINNEEFIKRLQKVIHYYGESASSFAEKIGVQRSSISHILSGRNKPSLDFVLKVLSSYPDVELYWLMNGKGNFPKKESSQSKLPIETENAKTQLPSELPLDHKSEGKAIERIVIFYKDGTFKNFEQSQ
ncbi:helix-turn-helix transcriptional regulator [Psychroserpens sp.]|uniref:helix-turn-helix domain-containing protein n=1 Tax=Psychroserpens sp. TaxID=2020870 RepID=UPI001B00504A|nr:helix-turn-helix transcriptional regulator [Psychroserpens sp.]MBO6606532.1 helix-turn-helix transcriptional regulator [Psychroserpens sp.]MBO6632311.1 helix-turn-helix transcriptional regulator [Psychroserpens sp.]MBO6653236.1 helix-turn-helix transcriptional regulator [Psychroserpens sp.]MBO6680737.1 helix-turn-helix transcriptional regulator [Psychroserpens sp.]MBO6750305.1 helix-turn-helix transcriptional regulator [Psychroserpens sp.]